MIGHIDRDNEEARLCANHAKCIKYPSYKDGYASGKADARDKNLVKTTKCPYVLTPDMLALLKKRARWIAGYQTGWNVINQKRQVSKKRKPKK